MEIEGSLLVVGLCPVSAVTQESNENPIAFLESLKEALQKCTNLDLYSYEGQMIFKGQIPVAVCIRHQDKVTTATAAGPSCLLK